MNWSETVENIQGVLALKKYTKLLADVFGQYRAQTELDIASFLYGENKLYFVKMN